jgi:hypothetical protein
MNLARLYDGFNPATGPFFDPGHHRVDDQAERERAARFLRDGTVVLRSLGLDVDAVEPGRGPVVPGSFRTDGEWIWSDAHAYYLVQHGIALPDEFQSHLAACQYRCPVPAADSVQQAAGLLLGQHS